MPCNLFYALVIYASKKYYNYFALQIAVNVLFCSAVGVVFNAWHLADWHFVPIAFLWLWRYKNCLKVENIPQLLVFLVSFFGLTVYAIVRMILLCFLSI